MKLSVIDGSAVTLRATSEAGREQVTQIAEVLDEMGERFPETRVEFETRHTLHAGVYSRTITVPEGVIFTSALVKIPTTVIIAGHCTVFLDVGSVIEVRGYHVIAAQAGRKQAYAMHEETSITMCFRTDARNVEDAEAEFTDEVDRLMSRHAANKVTVTGDTPCQAL